MSDCEKRQVEIITVNNGIHHFRGRGTTIVKPGWRQIDAFLSLDIQPEEIHDPSQTSDQHNHSTSLSEEDEEVDSLFAMAHQLKVDEWLECLLPAALVQDYTKPPPLLNEATLLHLMETAGRSLENEKKALKMTEEALEEMDVEESLKDFGLGTPATRAAIIEKLINVKYVRREGRVLIPTEKGKILVELLKQTRSSLLSPQLTGQWEKRLQDIWKQNADHSVFLDDIKHFTEAVVAEAKDGAAKMANFKTIMKKIDQFDDKKGDEAAREEPIEPETVEELGTCWKCGGTMVTKERWKAWSCSNSKPKGCDFVLWKQTAGRTMSKVTSLSPSSVVTLANLFFLISQRRSSWIF